MKVIFSILGIYFVLFLLSSSAGAQKFDENLRRELIGMEEKEQALRKKCNEEGDKMVDCYVKLVQPTDELNTRRLSEIVDRSGMPTVSMVGKDGFTAFMIVLQHATSDKLRERCLKPIKKAFRRKELEAQNYANFVDRLLVHQGKPQLYGCNFDIKDGKLVMSAVKDPRNLDERRAKIGLPPIEEYMRLLEEMYHSKATR